MKLVYLLILLVVISILIHDGDAWRRRRRWFRAPRVRLPRVRIPRVRIPRVRIPRIRIPRIRIPRIRLRFVSEKACTFGCGKLCLKVSAKLPQCITWCPPLCEDFFTLIKAKLPIVGKRGFTEQEIEDMKNLEAMPSDFSVYDEDKDKKISRDEFAKALSSSVRHSREAFDHGDANTDGFMDMDEFDHAPFYRDESDLELLKARFMSDDAIEDEDLDNELTRELGDLDDEGVDNRAENIRELDDLLGDNDDDDDNLKK